MSNSDDLEQLENDLLAIENLTQDGESVALRMRQRLNTQAAEIERLNEALKSAEHFADWALRHTWPERAKRNGPDAVYSILANHPFAKTLGGKP